MKKNKKKKIIIIAFVVLLALIIGIIFTSNYNKLDREARSARAAADEAYNALKSSYYSY